MCALADIVLVVMVIAIGPALCAVAYIESDYILSLRFLLSNPIAFYASAIVGFTLILQEYEKHQQPILTSMTVAVIIGIFLSILPFVFYTTFFFLMFVSGSWLVVYGIPLFIWASMAAVLALIFLKSVPKERGVYWQAAAMVASAAIIYALRPSVFLGDAAFSPGFTAKAPPIPGYFPAGPSRTYHMDVPLSGALLASLPQFLGLVPLIAFVLIRAGRPLPFRRAMLFILVSAAPVFLAVSAVEFYKGRMQAFLWPVRFIADYVPKSERDAMVERLTTISDGAPVHIGEHWYRFDGLEHATAKPQSDMRPQTNVYASLSMKPDVLGLPDAVGSPPHGSFGVSIAQYPLGIPPNVSPERSRTHVREGDLIIWFFRPGIARGWPENEVILDSLRRYIQSARTTPPEGAMP